MYNRNTKKLFIPLLYSILVLTFVVSMYFVGVITNRYLFNKNNDLQKKLKKIYL